MNIGKYNLHNFRNKVVRLSGTLTFRLESTSQSYIDVYLEGIPFPHSERPLFSTFQSRWKTRAERYVADLWEMLHWGKPSPDDLLLIEFLKNHLEATWTSPTTPKTPTSSKSPKTSTTN